MPLASRWYLLSYARELIPIFPVYAIMMQAHGLDPVEVSSLLIVWSLASFVFEVPSGTFGDRFSRRRVLVASRCIQAVAFFVWWWWPGYWGYAAGFVLWGLSGSLWSGTAEALLYESLTDEGEGHHFDRVYGRGAALATLGVATALLFGGWLANGGFALPLWLSTAMSFAVGAGVLFAFGDPPRALREGAEVSDRPPLRSAVHDFRSNPLVRHMALAIGLGLVYYGCFEEYVGLLFVDEGLTLTGMGAWYAVCYGARAVAMAFAERVRWNALTTLAVSGTVLLPGCAAGSLPLLIAACIAYFALNGIAEVRIVSVLQATQSGNARATVMSLARLGILATGPLVYVASGTLADHFGWIAAAWFAAVGTLCTSLALRVTRARVTLPPEHPRPVRRSEPG